MYQENTSREIDEGLEHVEATLAGARERAATLLKQVEDLEKNLKLARGTEDVAKEAKVATESVAKPTLAARIGALISARPMPLEEIARTTGEPAGLVSGALRAMRTTGRIRNTGSQTAPRWFMRPGPGATPKEVRAAVLALVSNAPLSFAEICEITGVKEGQVQGALVDIRRSDVKILNMGTPNQARYFAIPKTAVDAHLQPKAKK